MSILESGVRTTHKFWSMNVRADENRTDLYLLDEIAARQSWFGDEVTPKAFRRDIDQAVGTIYVWIDSPGGDAFAGAAIYDMLRDYAKRRGRVVAMVSLAASAASLIAMAADEIQISVVGTMMIHEPWSTPSGNAGELRAVADVLETVREGQIGCYAARTKQSREKIAELMRGPDGHGTYMNADESVALGFADGIMYAASEARMQSGEATRAVARARIASCIERGDAQGRQAVAATAARAAEVEQGVGVLAEALRDIGALLRGEITADKAAIDAFARVARAAMDEYYQLKCRDDGVQADDGNIAPVGWRPMAAATGADDDSIAPAGDADGGALALLIQAIEDTRDQGGEETYGDDDD